MSTSTPKKSRPRRGRILAVLLFFVLCVGALIALVRLHTAPTEVYNVPQAENVSQSESVSQSDSTDAPLEPDSGLQASPMSADGLVLSFADPGVSLDGLQHGTMDYHDNSNPSDGACAYCSLPLNAENPGWDRALARYDDADRTLAWLCDVPGCDHKSPACSAYLSDAFRDMYLDGDGLYLLMMDAVEGSFSLERYDLTDGSRAALLRVGEENFAPYVLFNDQAIVLVFGQSGRVYVYEKATGDCRQFMTLQECVPVSVDDHFVIVTARKADGSISYAAVDLAGGQERVLCDFPAPDGYRYTASPVQDGGFLYCLREKDAESCEFVRLDIATGEETVLNDSAFFPQDYTSNRLDDAAVVDGCYVYSIAPLSEDLQAEDFTDYSLNLATGALTTLLPAHTADCWRVAAFGDHYLVNTLTPTPNGDEINARDFRLIGRADYEAGNENYISIQDNTR